MSRAASALHPDPSETETQPPSPPDRFEAQVQDPRTYAQHVKPGRSNPPSPPYQDQAYYPPQELHMQEVQEVQEVQEAQEDAIMAIYNRHLNATHKALSDSSLRVNACFSQIQVKHDRCLFDLAMLARREAEICKEANIIGKKIQEMTDQK